MPIDVEKPMVDVSPAPSDHETDSGNHSVDEDSTHENEEEEAEEMMPLDFSFKSTKENPKTPESVIRQNLPFSILQDTESASQNQNDTQHNKHHVPRPGTGLSAFDAVSNPSFQNLLNSQANQATPNGVPTLVNAFFNPTLLAAAMAAENLSQNFNNQSFNGNLLRNNLPTSKPLSKFPNSQYSLPNLNGKLEIGSNQAGSGPNQTSANQVLGAPNNLSPQHLLELQKQLVNSFSTVSKSPNPGSGEATKTSLISSINNSCDSWLSPVQNYNIPNNEKDVNPKQLHQPSSSIGPNRNDESLYCDFMSNNPRSGSLPSLSGVAGLNPANNLAHSANIFPQFSTSSFNQNSSYRNVPDSSSSGQFSANNYGKLASILQQRSPALVGNGTIPIFEPQNIGQSSQNIGQSSQNIGHSSQNIGQSSKNIGQSSHHLTPTPHPDFYRQYLLTVQANMLRNRFGNGHGGMPLSQFPPTPMPLTSKLPTTIKSTNVKHGISPQSGSSLSSVTPSPPQVTSTSHPHTDGSSPGGVHNLFSPHLVGINHLLPKASRNPDVKRALERSNRNQDRHPQGSVIVPNHRIEIDPKPHTPHINNDAEAFNRDALADCGRGFTDKGRSLLPEEVKDDAYWERRRKNNEAAKRSRDARRHKEDEVAMRATVLEQENLKLRLEVAQLKAETDNLRKILLNS